MHLQPHGHRPLPNTASINSSLLWGHSSGTNATYFSNWLLTLPTSTYSCIKDVLRTAATGSQAWEQGSQDDPEAMAHTYPWAGRTLQSDSVRKALNKGGRKQTSFLPLKLLSQSSGHGEITLVFIPKCKRRPLCFTCCPGAFLGTGPHNPPMEDTVSPADPRILWNRPEPEGKVRTRPQDCSVAVIQMLPLCCQYLPGGLVKNLIDEATQEAHLHESPLNCILAYFANKDLPKIPHP